MRLQDTNPKMSPSSGVLPPPRAAPPTRPPPPPGSWQEPPHWCFCFSLATLQSSLNTAISLTLLFPFLFF